MACLKLKQLPGKLLHTQGLMPKLYAIRLRETTAILPSAPPRGLSHLAHPTAWYRGRLCRFSMLNDRDPQVVGNAVLALNEARRPHLHRDWAHPARRRRWMRRTMRSSSVPPRVGRRALRMVRCIHWC
jgi:hypothetical protein